jgi:hypothetical protein
MNQLNYRKCQIFAVIIVTFTQLITTNLVLAKPERINSQRASGKAVATGNNTSAVTHTYQSSHQQGLRQISQQEANANAVAKGKNSIAVSNIYQSNEQNQEWFNPINQSSLQQAKSRATARGNSNLTMTNIEQNNSQW